MPRPIRCRLPNLLLAAFAVPAHPHTQTLTLPLPLLPLPRHTFGAQDGHGVRSTRRTNAPAAAPAGTAAGGDRNKSIDVGVPAAAAVAPATTTTCTATVNGGTVDGPCVDEPGGLPVAAGRRGGDCSGGVFGTGNGPAEGGEGPCGRWAAQNIRGLKRVLLHRVPRRCVCLSIQ